MMIILPLRRVIGSLAPRAFPRVLADPTHRWHSDYACNFAHADRKDSKLLLVDTQALISADLRAGGSIVGTRYVHDAEAAVLHCYWL